MAKAPTLESLPANLKSVKHYLRIANEHDQKNPIISYYCRLYSMQKGMQIDSKSRESKGYLMGLMDYLENFKTQYKDVEALHNEIVAQASFEDYALKVFLYADNEDRASRFNKSVVRSFFTAGLLFDVLTVFGELSEDSFLFHNKSPAREFDQMFIVKAHAGQVEKNKKYAKWKATYIHKCLQSGEQPIPGPVGGDDGELIAPASSSIGFDGSSQFQDPTQFQHPTQFPGSSQFSTPGPSNQPPSYQPPPTNYMQPPPTNYMQPPAGTKAPPSTPQDPTQGYATGGSAAVGVSNSNEWVPTPNPAGLQLNPAQMQKAMKYSNYASSALRYDDSTTAIDYLNKALKLLTTGVDSEK